MTDTIQLVEDALTDAQLTDIPDEHTGPEAELSVDSSSPADSAPVSEPATESTLDSDPNPTDSPATEHDILGQDPLKANTEEDDFNKRFGLPAGKNNRIPYERVRKIVAKNERDITTKLTKQFEDEYKPKLTEYETKFKELEGTMANVAQFEHVMVNDPQRFLELLTQIPAYAPFFQYVNQLASGQVPAANEQQPAAAEDPMPGPDEHDETGAIGYSQEGLQKLQEWSIRQAEKKVEARIAPIENDWKAQRAAAEREHYVENVIKPQLEQQISEARTWPSFTDIEPEIVKLLNANKQLSLEGAYRQAYQTHVLPKLQADRDTMRQTILAELKNAKPANTAAPSLQSRPTNHPSNRPKTTEEIVAEIAAGLTK
jgi:hypothetical protein